MPLAREYDYISYSEYLEYTKNLEQKTEYSDGEIFYMSPIHPKHNKVQNRLYMQLENSLKECNKCEVYTSDIAVKFKDEEKEHQFEPDVMVECDGNFSGSIYVGIPTLVIEVLSRATRDRDKGLKLNVYEQFGVKQYWIVNIDLEEITVYSNNVNGKYKSIVTYTKEMTLMWNNSNIDLNYIFNK
ncbi:MAG: Uma2 family endonuclease [Clostridium celatum]|uniref:Uma2 family endonuclease n=1 Tax=Clostridium sp. TaxID=1506 RepID=UPI0025C38844|nr:Uma2 family endonuclease [Clostridium sp.]MBS4958521.1 Uma2 family endonuclease [Clostridium sp.]MDU2124096.1 Uma2 family endonuclease [Clostridium celatum]MDU4980381.1 Uma2 family endonuclease [Clostridium celatum]